MTQKLHKLSRVGKTEHPIKLQADLMRYFYNQSKEIMVIARSYDSELRCQNATALNMKRVV